MTRLAVLLAALLLLVGCASGPAATPPPAVLEIAGSTSMGPALAELAAAFQAQNPNVLVNVRGGGSGTGLSELQSGRVHVAAVSWLDPAAPALEGIVLTPLARDDIAIIVHPTNPITNLTALQVRALYRGETLDWSALTAAAGPPEIISREEGSGTRAAFEALAMGEDHVTLNARVMPTSQAVVDYIASHRLAVGYVTLAVVDDTVRVVPVEGYRPSIREGAYPITRLLQLAAPASASPAAQAFIAFATSAQAQPFVSRYHILIR